MDRIFQHYEGEVSDIKGAKLSRLKCLYDDEFEVNDVLLFWIQTDTSWLRIYIDGVYCGIDKYKTDESHEDEDEDDNLRLVNYDLWVKDKYIEKATVKSDNLPLITLTILLSDISSIVLDCNKDEICSLKNIKTQANKTYK